VKERYWPLKASATESSCSGFDAMQIAERETFEKAHCRFCMWLKFFVIFVHDTVIAVEVDSKK